ncbi:MAG: hypothetical protein RLZZ618_2198 [Pseudomonadota bacterium]|jgi:hypothetical protein
MRPPSRFAPAPKGRHLVDRQSRIHGCWAMRFALDSDPLQPTVRFNQACNRLPLADWQTQIR